MKSLRYVSGGILFSLLFGLALGQAVERLWTQRKAPFPIPVPSGLDTNFSATDTSKNPYLTEYLATTNANGSAVVIRPGGGYEHLSPIREGKNVAIKFNGYGVSGFVLRYRLGTTTGGGNHHPIEMWDVQRAVRWVRANAARFGIDPHRVGVIGFSAGGHLASTVATHYDLGNPDNTSIDYYPGAKDSVDGYSCKPDFQILGYPVINMDNSAIAHAGSVTALLGTSPSAAVKTLLSNEKQVTSATPPAFITATLNDATVPFANSQNYADSLNKKGVARRLLSYPMGSHGFGLADGADGAVDYRTPPNDVFHWPDSAKVWMQSMGYFTPTTALLPHRRAVPASPVPGASANRDVLDLLGRRVSVHPHAMFFTLVKPRQ